MKTCFRCKEDLPLSGFGRDRSSKDGLNYYCRNCIRQRNIDRRESRKQYDEVRRKQCKASYPVWRLNLGTRDSVLMAIRRGANNQSMIKTATRLKEDEITDALAELWSENKLDRSALKRREYIAA